MEQPDYVNRNRVLWDEDAPNWVEMGERAWALDEPNDWGIWGIPESELKLFRLPRRPSGHTRNPARRYGRVMPAPMIPYRPNRLDAAEQTERARAFHAELEGRRSVRFFSNGPVSRELIELAIASASTAPSGAHRQPWTFVVTGDPELKRRIRDAAEEEERINYEGGRLPPHWREALEPLGTDWRKEFLETVPWIVVLFEQRHGVADDGSQIHNFYVKESCGIAAGLFIAALNHMGLATLTHTPSPMAFLTKLLGRPHNERPFCMFPIGYPAEDCVVPDLRRKALAEVMVEVGEAP